MLTPLEQAIRYRSDYGFSVVPVGENKVPLVAWKEFQERPPTYDEIRGWWTKFPTADVGIVTGVVSGVVVVDIDDMYALDELTRYFPESLVTPVVNTPCGGQHWYFKHPGGLIGNATGVVFGVDFRGDGGQVVAPPSPGYSWVIEPTVELAELPASFIALLKPGKTEHISAYQDISVVSPVSDLANPAFSQGSRDNDLFHVACLMAKGGATKEEVTGVVLEMAAACRPPFPRDQALIKVRSAFLRHVEGFTAGDIKTWVETSTGYFPVADLIRDFDVKTPAQKANLRNILSRLKASGVIELYGNRAGTYRLAAAPPEFEVLSGVPEIDEFPLRWPLKVEDLVKVTRGSVVVVAGETNAGKTAFMINFCDLNLDMYKIRYFSTETSAGRFVDRIKHLSRPRKDWDRVLFTDKVLENFHLHIDPAGVNIVDYLEPDVEALWRISLTIQRIFEKLTTGVAIICVQKKKGCDYGYGGVFTAFKSELYLAIACGDKNRGELKVIKGKAWRSPRCNPNMMKKRFFIIDGVNFHIDPRKQDWFLNEGEDEKDY